MTQAFILILSVGFLALGLGKLLGVKALKESLLALGLPLWSRWLIGGTEVLGAFALAISAFQPFLTFFAALLLLVICLGAIAFHILRPPRRRALPAAALGLGLIAAGGIQPLGLQVLALPKAETFPLALAPSKQLQTYNPGMFVESISVDSQGNAYLTRTSGLDLATGDMSKVNSDILVRRPDGKEEVFFKMEPQTMAGVTAISADDTLYLASQGARTGIWRFKPGAAAEFFAPAPTGVWPNGLKFGPDGKLYLADSAQGIVWRVDPVNGEFSAALTDDRLKPRRFIALAPGANGLAFHGPVLYLTVSDKGLLLKTSLQKDGVFSPLEQVSAGIPGDDMAIAENGDVYVATHPYDTVIRITPNGERTTIADATTGAKGATALAFGRGVDSDHLYMVTDGGAFGGIPNAAGTLVKLTLQ
jgi:sugar lactone lactonase YvrE/uncharacterized membrane protein YphA (DoxX/SURF4 family)